MRGILISILVIMGLAAFWGQLVVGEADIPGEHVWSILWGGLASNAELLIMDQRLAYALTSVGACMALGSAGMLLQSYFNNPLADPGVLGVSSGSSLAVLLGLLTFGGLGLFGQVALAAIGAGGIILLIVLMDLKLRRPSYLLIAGLMVGFITSAVSVAILSRVDADITQSYVAWGFGSFYSPDSRLAWTFLLCVIGLQVPVFFGIRWLNATIPGISYARSLGVHIPRGSFLILLVSGLSIALATAFCGPVGFVGLVSPHITRWTLRTNDHSRLIPFNLLFAAVFGAVAGLLTKWPYPLPVNAIMVLFGAPVVLLLIFKAPRRL